jgi:hypothetical protein
MAEKPRQDKARATTWLIDVQLSPNSPGVTIPPWDSQHAAMKRRH